MQDGVVVREFVPCRREADGAVGLYDIAINEDEPSYERFYANRGTGSLTVGTSLDVVDGKASVVFQLAANSAADYERFQCLQDVSSRFYETTPGGLAIIVR